MKQPATLPTLRRQGAALTVLALAVVLAALAGLCFGSQGYTPLQLWQAWCSGDPQNAVYRVLLHVRWPRTLAGLLAGSALAAAGVLLQAVLNNAMASPNVIGVNAGAGLAALCAAALWPAHPNAVQPAAFAGALAAALLVYGLALGAGVSRTTLVLAGLAVSGMLTAGMNTIKLLYPDAIAGASDFLVGGLSGVTLSGLKGAVLYLITGTLLALLLAQVKYRLTTKQARMMFRELSDTAEQIQWILDTQTEAVHEAALLCKDAQSALFVGRGMGAAISYEGALKLKEVSYLHAEAYAAGEMKHGPIALIDPGFPVIAVATKSATYDKTVSNLMECKARGAKVIVVATEGDEEINKIADCIIRVPAVRDVFSPITASVPLQLLAREVAILRGCDVDQPRNLAKSVTVE